jgi:diguanylate cyclase (GGDEF)-like protein
MNYTDRNDPLLLIGFAMAMFVLFARPIQYLLDVARDVETSLGLTLVPALVILTVAFVFHQQQKRQEERAQARTAAAEAAQAEARAAELERLVTFGQSLGRSLDRHAIRAVVLQQLPRLADNDRTWVVVRQDSGWQLFAHPADEDGAAVEDRYLRIVERAMSDDLSGAMGPVTIEGHYCLPMEVGGEIAGVVGVPESSVNSQGRQRVLAAAAALLGITLRNAQLFHEVKDNSLRDGLTGLYNRTHALEAIGAELRRARRTRAPLSLIMLDLDHFKQINDRHGHLAGDAVLATVGARMRDALRGSDLKCRYGGEEFLVLLPDTPLEGAQRVAETLRRTLADRPFFWKNERLQVTASFGVTVAVPAETDPQGLVGRADQAMYKAKRQGRNCVLIGAVA